MLSCRCKSLGRQDFMRGKTTLNGELIYIYHRVVDPDILVGGGTLATENTRIRILGYSNTRIRIQIPV